jgi:hypothetical protein
MDVEREIEKIEIETDVNHNFDDAKITINNEEIYCQMKDYNDVSLKDLRIDKKSVFIKSNRHVLSKGTNILFFKNIEIINSSEILGIPAQKEGNVYIVSLSRIDISDKIEVIYIRNEKRINKISRFFENCFDKRKIIIHRKDLPPIDIFSTELLEPTINTGKYHLEIENLLLIEGKPGIGKSHLVNILQDEYKNNLLYRFWVSNQDRDNKERLIYDNFISNISKEIFRDFVYRSDEEIIQKLCDDEKMVIIDGFDHIENYNNEELERYIIFIEKMKDKCKTIVLSRPLKSQLKWTKQILENWTKDQTYKVLDELYHITHYSIRKKIFNLTMGYPILVRYIAEHFKIFKNLPKLSQLEGIEDYYEKLLEKVNTKSALSLFISLRSFIMKSEIQEFLEDEFVRVVEEFITSHPYLFEIRLNRITIFHDSFNTFLRNQGIDNSKRIIKVNQIVFQSIMNEEKRYLSRFSYFDFEHDMKLNIIKKYTSMDVFKIIAKDALDFEAIRSFYFQIRESLNELHPDELEVSNYYNLALIINILNRDHVSYINSFLYIYVNSLLLNGFNEEDVTSSEYLFAMLYYIRCNDMSMLHNVTRNNHYSTNNYYKKLKTDTRYEDHYFQIHQNPIELTQEISDIFSNKINYKSQDLITHILVNVYLHGTEISEFIPFHRAIVKYIESDKMEGILELKKILYRHDISSHVGSILIAKAYNVIKSLGECDQSNEYRKLSLHDYILKYSHIGSFKMWVEVLNYIRLSMHEKREIDLSSIGLFWSMYHERKDYSVVNMDVALTAFEEKNLISEEESCKLIVYTQSISEKGIRYLFNSYIELHSPDIISTIIENFEMNDLQIKWFDLPTRYIDFFPHNLFNYAIDELLRYNSYSRSISFRDIENCLHSNKWEEIVQIFKTVGFTITSSDSHPLIDELKKYDIILKIGHNKDDDSKYKKDSNERYNQGIVDSDDIEFIKERNISIKEISGYTDGNYSVLSDLYIYKIYEKEDVRKNIHTILYNAILGKIRNINMFSNLYYFVGNLPRFLINYSINENFNELFNSFMSFLEISLLTEKEKN